ncbi:MAG TPA: hypothetical protein PLX01_03700 [Candidatus Magasanikbacteria bacterium]|nr:hypothetical protein [Candidatus Magasanikbacteria bacterium]
MIKKIIILSIFFTFVFGFFSFVETAGPEHKLSDVAMSQVHVAASEQGAGLGVTKDPQKFIVDIINMALGAVGILFTSLIFYGGMIYLTAQGEEEKAKKGAKIVKASVIGLLIVLASYAIVLFVSITIDKANVSTEDFYL